MTIEEARKLLEESGFVVLAPGELQQVAKLFVCEIHNQVELNGCCPACRAIGDCDRGLHLRPVYVRTDGGDAS